jgi:acyl-CoA synthetase (AMP-forming)/AMP-acid ligase II
LANAAYSVLELTHQLTSSGVKVLFTCLALLDTALGAADAAGIAREHIFILPMVDNDGRTRQTSGSSSFLTIDDLISEGEKLPALEPLKWSKGQGARQPAFLCYSSGTSGLPV